MLTVADLLDLNDTIAADLFAGKNLPPGRHWRRSGTISAVSALPCLRRSSTILRRMSGLRRTPRSFPPPTSAAPCIIDHEAEIRHCAFIRGSAIVGKKAVVGNSVELKNVILFDYVQTPITTMWGIPSWATMPTHGGRVHHLQCEKRQASGGHPRGDRAGSHRTEKKVGAILGNYVEVGCNSVLNPGTVIGPHSNVYPTSSVRGTILPTIFIRTSTPFFLRNNQKRE